MTYFDPARPRERGMCGYCPGRAARAAASPAGLLQIRRSTYHEVCKASDLARLADVTGVQHYVINGAKVLFLCPRPQPRPPKGVAAPSRCAVDGRQLMDAGARFCSLRCKLEGEDAAYAARHALCTARARADSAALASELAAASAAGGPGLAAAAAAAAAAANGSDAGASDQAPAAKRVVVGLARFEAAGGDDDSGAEFDHEHEHGHLHSRHHHHQQQQPQSVSLHGRPTGRRASDQGGAPHARAPASRRASEEGASVDAAPRWGGRGKRSRAGVPSAGAAARAHAQLHGGAANGNGNGAAAAAADDGPTSSHDSGRSSTFRWHASKRRKGEPVRAPLQ